MQPGRISKHALRSMQRILAQPLRFSALQSRRVCFAGVLFPILAEAAMRRLLVRVGAEFFDIDVNAEPGSGWQIDPTVLHGQ